MKKMWDKKLPIGDPSDSKFISQNVLVFPDNLMEPMSSKTLLPTFLNLPKSPDVKIGNVF